MYNKTKVPNQDNMTKPKYLIIIQRYYIDKKVSFLIV